MPQGSISLQGMCIDCLNSIKHFALVEAFNTLESSNPQVRQAFNRMAQEHQSMAEDWFQLMHRRGWYQVPNARPEIRSHVNNFISSLQSNMGMYQMATGQVGQQMYGQQTYGQQSVAQQGRTQGTQKYLT